MSEDIKSHLLVEKKGRIAYVTLNRPEVLNALTEAHWQQLANTWRALDDDPDVWVIIITGSGERAFCTGQDLKDVASEGPDAWRGAYSVESPPGMPNMYEMYTATPAIAAINGFCIAGGLGDCAQLRHKGGGRACAVRPAGSAVGNHSQRRGGRQAAEGYADVHSDGDAAHGG